MALPRGDIRGTSPQHRDEVCYFEFELQGGLELKATAYSLRNGSKDYGTYPNAWVLQQCDGDGDWTTIAREAGDELDGNRQALRKFKIEVSPASTPPGFASRFRIKSSGPRLERHPLWLLSLEFFGTLRRKAPCGPSGSTSLPARVTAAGGLPYYHGGALPYYHPLLGVLLTGVEQNPGRQRKEPDRGGRGGRAAWRRRGRR